MDIIDQIKGITDPKVLTDIINIARGNKSEFGGRIKKEDPAKKLAEELQEFTNNIFSAKDAYVSKGLTVEIKTNKNGLVTKWVLKRNPNASAVRTMTVDEFKSILGRLGDGELKSSDIQNALIGSGIGARKLQPTLGNILRGMYGPLIEKANDEVRGPGVRYRKVK